MLDIALERAEQSLNALLGSATGEFFLYLCGTYLLLAGLHRCRRDIVECGSEDNRRFNNYLSEAWRLLEVRKASHSDATGEPKVGDPDVCYERACYEVMAAGDFASGVDICRLLSDAVVPQPGWYNRAKTDFRLEPFRKDKRQWKIFDEMVRKGIKEKVIVIGKEDQV